MAAICIGNLLDGMVVVPVDKNTGKSLDEKQLEVMNKQLAFMIGLPVISFDRASSITSASGDFLCI